MIIIMDLNDYEWRWLAYSIAVNKVVAPILQDKASSIQSMAGDEMENARRKCVSADLNDWSEAFSSGCFSELKACVEKSHLTRWRMKSTLDGISYWKDIASHKVHCDDREVELRKDSNQEHAARSYEAKEGKELLWTHPLYRAGTDESPSFEINDNAVWLLRNPALFSPVNEEQRRYSTRAKRICLWRTFIGFFPDSLVTEPHPSLKDVVVVKMKDTPGAQDSSKELEKSLRSMIWTKSTIPTGDEGLSAMNVNFLVRAVLMYLDETSPGIPKEYNFQAELKAASHWRFLKDNEHIKFVTGPFDDERVKNVARIALKRWKEELSKIKNETTDKVRESLDVDGNESDGYYSKEERISDLEEDIFAVSMYYKINVEESDCQSSPKNISENRSNPSSNEDKNDSLPRKRRLRNVTEKKVSVHRKKGALPKRKYQRTTAEPEPVTKRSPVGRGCKVSQQISTPLVTAKS